MVVVNETKRGHLLALLEQCAHLNADVRPRTDISMPCIPADSIWISAPSGAINFPFSLMRCSMGRSIFWIW